MKGLIFLVMKSAKYFGTMFDSRNYLSHTGQMTDVIKYARNHSGKVEATEVFLGLFQVMRKKKFPTSFLKSVHGERLDIKVPRSWLR